MKKPILPCVAAITIVLALASFALAQDGRSDSNRWGFNLGIGGTFSTSEYRGVERLGTALPILGYEGQWLYLRGLSGGVHLFKNEYHEVNVQLSYLPQHFYASWSDSSAMKKLDDRYSSVMAGINYRLRTELGTDRWSISFVVPDHSISSNVHTQIIEYFHLWYWFNVALSPKLKCYINR